MAPPPPPPNFPTTPTAQYAQQFLSTALSQRGPSALPYTEDSKWQIRHHLVSLTSAFPSLHPKSSSFTHNDGRTVNLLMADGTIPISYHSVFYNIPASIWLLEHYPRQSPSVFLTPTSNMVVKPNHPYVDRNGAVHVPYLRSWVYPSSNLVDLVRSLSDLFGQDPPLYTRQNPNPNPNPSPSPAPNPSLLSPSPPPSRIYSASSLSPYPGRIPAQQPQQMQHPPPSQRPMEDLAEVYRRNAISKILDSVHGDIASLRKTQEAEMEGLFNTQATLRQRGDEISNGLREMVEEKEGLEQQLQLVLMNTDVLEGWVRENEGKKRRDFDADSGDVFEPADVYSRQIMECASADLALEDTLYSLDKAVQEGAIPFNMYLKSVRALSREQFFHRALAAKVRAQVQVAAMAARARPQYVL